ncbi:hypothetical protein BpHYR1_048960 [Brachionus plicatilis]|uniref:Uncharacterized protein n=1 Tax=Brachionus plicatilis TaxID=10195 RepID=A0A3M7R204_BRAPC|nr:hypothetical protein BpHYR1_048960 [Brachionus plicatilis]
MFTRNPINFFYTFKNRTGHFAPTSFILITELSSKNIKIHLNDLQGLKAEYRMMFLTQTGILLSLKKLFVSKIIFSSAEVYIGQQNYFLANYNNNTTSSEQRIS